MGTNMKVSTVALGLVLAAAVVSAADEEPVTVTTTFYGETDTHKWGRFDKTKPASTSTSSGTHKWGRFDKTKPSSEPTSSGTHKWGRFDKTQPSSNQPLLEPTSGDVLTRR